MFDRLPPIQTLRAVEAAARRGSFVAASRELHVTHGAVSHQIRAIEKRLGCKLFRRDGHRMVPTAAGERIAEEIRRGLEILSEGFDRLRAELGTQRVPLVVSVPPPLANAWLVPRLAAFQERHREIDVALRTTPELVEPDYGEVDLAIRCGTGDWPGVKSEKLLDEIVFPVCSPGFLAAHPGMKLEDLKSLPLLRHAYWPWTTWFRAAGLPWPEPTRGPLFDDASHLLDAAAAGQGIGLARALVARDDLAAGRLVRLFDVAAPAMSGDYFITWREAAGKEEAVAAFRDWLATVIAAG